MQREKRQIKKIETSSLAFFFCTALRLSKFLEEATTRGVGSDFVMTKRYTVCYLGRRVITRSLSRDRRINLLLFQGVFVTTTTVLSVTGTVILLVFVLCTVVHSSDIKGSKMPQAVRNPEIKCRKVGHSSALVPA